MDLGYVQRENKLKIIYKKNKLIKYNLLLFTLIGSNVGSIDHPVSFLHFRYSFLINYLIKFCIN